MWKKYLASVALSAALVVAAVPAQAQDADNIADIRCVAVGIRFAELPDSHQKSTGTLLVLYYIGRLDGRAPSLDIETLLAQQIAKMSDADYGVEATRCGKWLAVKGEQITHIGEDMMKNFTGAPRK
jgi:hypothetical protein